MLMGENEVLIKSDLILRFVVIPLTNVGLSPDQPAKQAGLSRSAL
jgi:hypothetical protein